MSPGHVAFIIDGNRRWARRHNRSVEYGHEKGVENIWSVDELCSRRAISWRSYYILSSANLRRDQEEVDHLLSLFARLFEEWDAESHTTAHLVGDVAAEHLPLRFREAADKLCNRGRMVTDSSGNVVFFVNYDGRAHSGRDDSCLETIPAIDLIVRTGGEKRLSGFIPPQIAYSELAFVDCSWPEFSAAALDQVLVDFAHRNRRFGC